MLTDDVSPEDWDRLSRFAAYVHAIQCWDSEYYRNLLIKSSVWHWLQSEYPGPQPLFPNLHDLTGMRCSPHKPNILSLPLPSLRALHIHIPNTTDEHPGISYRAAINFMLRRTFRGSPLLSDVSLTWQWLDFTSYLLPEDACSLPVLVEMKRLHRLNIMEACIVEDMEFLRVLAALVHLQRLDINIRWPTDQNPEFVGFPELRELRLLVEDDTRAHVCTIFASPHLHSLWLKHDTLTSRTLRRAIQGVSQRHPLLQVLEWEIGRISSNAPAIPVAQLCTLSEVLEPLLLRPMRQIALYAHSTKARPIARITQEDMSQLAKAWPTVTHIVILLPLADTVSEKALVPFAKHCPSLEVLRLTNVMFRLDSEEALEAYPRLKHRLGTLCLNDVKFANKELSGKLLARLFARLSGVATEYSRDPDDPWDMTVFGMGREYWYQYDTDVKAAISAAWNDEVTY